MIKSLFIFCVLTCSFHVFGQIRVTNPVHDLGEVCEHGGQVKTTFVLQNPYRNDTIRIVNIETSCDCTAILTKDTLILPNSQIALDVAYDPSGRCSLFIKSIEITTRTGSVEENIIASTPQTYMVNFDYFINGIYTGARGFQRFAPALALMVLKDRYVELRIESGISKIPIEKNQSNLFVAYKRLLVSQNRLKKALEEKLIDPNRILFVDEEVVEQGPVYDGSVPIINYRKYNYLRILPEKLLQN